LRHGEGQDESRRAGIHHALDSRAAHFRWVEITTIRESEILIVGNLEFNGESAHLLFFLGDHDTPSVIQCGPTARYPNSPIGVPYGRIGIGRPVWSRNDVCSWSMPRWRNIVAQRSL